MVGSSVRKVVSGDIGRGSDRALYQVMVVDDSAVIRGFITRMLEADPDFRVVTTAANGEIAV